MPISKDSFKDDLSHFLTASFLLHYFNTVITKLKKRKCQQYLGFYLIMTLYIVFRILVPVKMF